jgi:tetratricopeptide (TPR) repeat protein
MKRTLFSFSVFGLLVFVLLACSHPGRTEAKQDPLACSVLIAQRISDTSIKDDALAGIAEYHLEAGRFDKALDVVRSIDDASPKVSSLSRIAAKYSEVGQQEQALGMLSEALSLAEAFDPGYFDKYFVFTHVAHGYIAAGKPEQALQLLQRIRYESFTKDGALETMALIFADNGEYNRALTTVSYIRDAFDRSRALTRIAMKYLRGGKKEQALRLLGQALEVARTAERLSFRTRALAEIGSRYAEIGQMNQASSVIDEALQTSRMIKTVDSPVKPSRMMDTEDRASKAMILSELAVKYAMCGKYGEAFLLAEAIEEPHSKGPTIIKIARPEYFDEVLRLIQTIDDSYVRACALADLGVKYAEVGKNKEALMLLDQALSAADMTEDKYYKALALADVGERYSRVGESEKSRQILSSSLEAARAVRDAYHKSRVLVIIGVSYVKAGQPVDDSAKMVLGRIISEL